VFWLAVRLNGLDWVAAKWCLFGFILVELLFSDLETRILPDEFTLGGWMAAIALAPLAPPPRGVIALFMEGQSARFVGVAGAVLGSVILGRASVGSGLGVSAGPEARRTGARATSNCWA